MGSIRQITRTVKGKTYTYYQVRYTECIGKNMIPQTVVRDCMICDTPMRLRRFWQETTLKPCREIWDMQLLLSHWMSMVM